MCAAIETASRNALDDTRRRDSTASRSWRCAGVTLPVRNERGVRGAGSGASEGWRGDGNELVADSRVEGYGALVLLNAALNLVLFWNVPRLLRGTFLSV